MQQYKKQLENKEEEMKNKEEEWYSNLKVEKDKMNQKID